MSPKYPPTSRSPLPGTAPHIRDKREKKSKEKKEKRDEKKE